MVSHDTYIEDPTDCLESERLPREKVPCFIWPSTAGLASQVSSWVNFCREISRSLLRWFYWVWIILESPPSSPGSKQGWSWTLPPLWASMWGLWSWTRTHLSLCGTWEVKARWDPTGGMALVSLCWGHDSDGRIEVGYYMCINYVSCLSWNNYIYIN